MSKEPVGVSGSQTDGGYNAGIAVFSYVVGGILVWSLIGWGLDILFGSSWIVLAGALVGAAGGFYLAFAHRLFHRAPEGAVTNTDAQGPAGIDAGGNAPGTDSQH